MIIEIYVKFTFDIVLNLKTKPKQTYGLYLIPKNEQYPSTHKGKCT